MYSENIDDNFQSSQKLPSKFLDLKLNQLIKFDETWDLKYLNDEIQKQIRKNQDDHVEIINVAQLQKDIKFKDKSLSSQSK